MEQISTEQISLFAEDNAPETINNTMTTKIDVVKMKYEYAESVIWQDLFSGFDSICAITFSSSIGFINQLLNLFDTAEIIFLSLIHI